jgi:hypothetical protein
MLPAIIYYHIIEAGMFVKVENVTGEDPQRYVNCKCTYVEELRISYYRIWECKVAIENVTSDELLKYVVDKYGYVI